jgi:hypothetical protein
MYNAQHCTAGAIDTKPQGALGRFFKGHATAARYDYYIIYNVRCYVVRGGADAL